MSSQDRPAELGRPPLSDEQARAQVVEPAKRIVSAVPLQLLTGGFRFGSCTDQGYPPFRGVVGMGFIFPAGSEEKAYVERIAVTMVAAGWSDGPPAGKKPHGRVVHQGDMMAIIAANPTIPARATSRSTASAATPPITATTTGRRASTSPTS